MGCSPLAGQSLRLDGTRCTESKTVISAMKCRFWGYCRKFLRACETSKSGFWLVSSRLSNAAAPYKQQQKKKESSSQQRHVEPYIRDHKNIYGTGRPTIIYSKPETAIDHGRLRTSTLLSQQLIRSDRFERRGDKPSEVWIPSPASQMTAALSFGYCFFHEGKAICPDMLAKAASILVSELPHLAGRMRKIPYLPLLQSWKKITIENNNKGVLLSLAKSMDHCINDLGPSTWACGMENRNLDGFDVPFYAETLDVQKIFKGEEPLLKLRLTECRDGQILGVAISHLLVDAGRALRIVQRLAHIYTCMPSNSNIGSPLTFNPKLESVEGFSEALIDPVPSWKAWPPDHGLTLKQWITAPYRMWKHVTKKFDVHIIYLPQETMRRLKTLAVDETVSLPFLDGWEARDAPITSMDAVQAFLATLCADLKRWPLVPIFPQEMTVNVDMIGPNYAWKDLGSVSRHLGNMVHILHVPGIVEEKAHYAPLDPNETESTALRRLKQSISVNARLIRRSISSFRGDATGVLRALRRQSHMVELPAGRVAAAYIVKGEDMKLASSTAITSFPFHKVRICNPSCACQFCLTASLLRIHAER